METLQQAIKHILEKANLHEVRVEADAEHRRVAVFVDEGEWLKAWLPRLVDDVHHLANVIARREGLPVVTVDINNYRKERERIIVELAKAAARKALLTKAEVRLPAMNAYERRLIHVELATRPDVTTESMGAGAERGVVVKPL